jgi:hypothetical protein
MANLDMNRLVQESMSGILKSGPEKKVIVEGEGEPETNEVNETSNDISPHYVGLVGAGVGVNKFLKN